MELGLLVTVISEKVLTFCITVICSRMTLIFIYCSVQGFWYAADLAEKSMQEAVDKVKALPEHPSKGQSKYFVFTEHDFVNSIYSGL